MMVVILVMVVWYALKPRRTALQCATDSNHRDAELVLRQLMGLEVLLCCNNLKDWSNLLARVEGSPLDTVRKCGLDDWTLQNAFLIVLCFMNLMLSDLDLNS